MISRNVATILVYYICFHFYIYFTYHCCVFYYLSCWRHASLTQGHYNTLYIYWTLCLIAVCWLNYLIMVFDSCLARLLVHCILWHFCPSATNCVALLNIILPTFIEENLSVVDSIVFPFKTISPYHGMLFNVQILVLSVIQTNFSREVL